MADNKLVFKGLVNIESDTLRSRYFTALEELIGKTVDLPAFHIDASGFSPEVADILEDTLYLNPNGINKKFIFITPDQFNLAVLDTSFDYFQKLFKQFTTDNKDSLVALLARDALYGEIDNSTMQVKNIEDLCSIKNLTFKMESAKGMFDAAQRMNNKIEVFNSNESAWCDDNLLGEIIELSKIAGDCRRYNSKIEKTTYTRNSYFTSHYNGVFFFTGENRISGTIICLDSSQIDKGSLVGPHKDYKILDTNDVKDVFEFLNNNKLVDVVMKPSEYNKVLVNRMVRLAIRDYAEKNPSDDLNEVDWNFIKQQMVKEPNLLSNETDKLFTVVKYLNNGYNLTPPFSSDIIFHLTRPTNSSVSELVSSLIGSYRKRDLYGLYYNNRFLFEMELANAPENYQKYVVDRLLKE